MSYHQFWMRLLHISATSVPSGHLFSKSGEVVCKKRVRLALKTVKHIVFLNANQKYHRKIRPKTHCIFNANQKYHVDKQELYHVQK